MPLLGQDPAYSGTCCLRPGSAEEVEEVAVHDAFDVGVAVAAVAEQRGHLLEVGDGGEVSRGLFFAEAAVEVCADAAVVRVAGQLADVVDVVDDVRHADGLRI